MKFRLVAAAILLTLSGSVAPALAADGQNGNGNDKGQPDLGRFGPYVSVAAAYDWRNSATGDETGGINARLGLRIFRLLAVEFEYEWQGADPSAYTVGGNLKALPFTLGTLQPFALVGAAYWDLDHGPSDVGIRAGIGVDKYFTDHIFLTAGLEYMWGLDDLDPNSFCTLYGGVGFRL